MIYPTIKSLVQAMIRPVINGDSGAASAYLPEAQAIFDAFTTPPDDTRKALINDTVSALMTAGIWSLLDNLQVYAAADSQAALINWKAPGTNNGSLVNAPAFKKGVGFRGDGSTSYINTNFNPTDGGIGATQDDMSFGAWLLSHQAPTTPNASQITGAFTTSPAWGTLLKHYNSASAGQQVAARANNDNTINFTWGGASHIGLCAVDRAASGAFNAWRNGVDLGSTSQTSVAPQNKDFFVLAANGASGAANFVDATAGMAWAGRSLGALQATIYTIFQTYFAGASYPYVNAEAAAVVNAMAVDPTDARKGLIDNLIGSLKSAGAWSKLDSFYVPAAHDQQAARLNWVSPFGQSLVEVNSPTWTANLGYTGNGSSSYVHTGVAMNALTKFQLNDAHISAYGMADVTAADQYFWGVTSGARAVLVTDRSDGFHTITYRMNTSSDTSIAGAGGSKAHWLVNRVGAADTSVYKNGTLVNNSATSSTAVSSDTLAFLARKSGGGAANFSTETVGQMSVGSSFDSDAQRAAVTAAVATYLTAIGAI